MPAAEPALPADPERETAEDEHPEPAGGDLVEWADRGAGLRGEQLPGVEDVGQLRGEHLGQAGEGGDGEERCHEHTGVEVQAQHERA